jgi:hypothetical protein
MTFLPVISSNEFGGAKKKRVEQLAHNWKRVFADFLTHHPIA